jgi:hypothetical protein
MVVAIGGRLDPDPQWECHWHRDATITCDCMAAPVELIWSVQSKTQNKMKLHINN